MKKSDMILSMIAGIAAGLVLAVLYAPEKGSKTRRKIFKKGEEVVEDLKDKAYILAAYANQLNNEIERMTDTIGVAIEDATNEATAQVEKYFRKEGR